MSDSPTESTVTAERVLIDRIVGFVAEQSREAQETLRANLMGLCEKHGSQSVARLIERLLTTGASFTYYPPEPLAKLIHYAVAELAVTPDSGLLDGANLAPVRDRSAVFLSNHLSYSDANLFQILLYRAGWASIADRLTVIAGPKVYSEPMRRFSSLAFGTIKTPQSSTRSSDEAVMSAREVARRALATIEIARERQRAGDALLIFVEGTRSRTASMQRALPAVARYLEGADTLLVPIAVSGSERFVPVGEERVHPTRVSFRIGKPIAADLLSSACASNKRLAMDAVGVAIGRLLPGPYRGVYAESRDGATADTRDELQEARRVSDRAFGSG